MGDRARCETQRHQGIIEASDMLRAPVQALTVDARDRAERPPQPVEIVQDHFQDQAAALGGVGIPVWAAPQIGKARHAGRADGDGPAHAARIHETLSGGILREITQHMAGHGGHPRAFHGGDHGVAVGEGTRQRRLDKNGLARRRRPFHILAVEGRGRTDINDVRPRLGQQGGPVAEARPGGVGRLASGVQDADEFGVRQGAPVARMDAAHDPGPD